MPVKYSNVETGLLNFLKILKQYSPGEKIAPASEMSRMLHVSLTTYTKIVALGRRHGHVTTKIGKGTFVTYRIPKIGIILGNGKIFPMFPPANLLQEILKQEKGIEYQLLNTNHLEDLTKDILTLKINLLLILSSYRPSLTEVNFYRKIGKETGIPAVFIGNSIPEGPLIPPVYSVASNDDFAISEFLSEEKKSRSSLRLLSCGEPWLRLEKMRKYFPGRELVFLPVYDPQKIKSSPEHFLRFLRGKKPHILILGGGISTYQAAFDVIQRLRPQNRPEVYCNKRPEYELEWPDMERFQALNLKGIFYFDKSILGRVGESISADFLLKKKPLQNYLANDFKIIRFPEKTDHPRKKIPEIKDFEEIPK